MKYWSEETIDQIRRGYFSAVYFNRTKEILLKEKNYKKVTMQIFQKHNDSLLCGTREVAELLEEGAGYYQDKDWISKSREIKIEALKDGDKIKAWESVIHITGPYLYFAHLESLYLGILARRTLVATNTRKVVEAAGKKPFGSAQGKQVIFFADRFDDFVNQTGDGYSAKIGGVSAVCTMAMSEGFGQEPVGTIPHALIAINDGNTVQAAKIFAKHYPQVKLIVLTDFDNDCVRTALAIAKELGKKLWGVRIDTAENLIDRSLKAKNSNLKTQSHNLKLKADKKISGVSPTLVKMVRKALDQEGFEYVRIVVSGGFNEEKIKRFEKEKTPVDVYGVGSALVHGENDFTADVVKVEGNLVAKVGREFKPNNRLQNIN